MLSYLSLRSTSLDGASRHEPRSQKPSGVEVDHEHEACSCAGPHPKLVWLQSTAERRRATHTMTAVTTTRRSRGAHRGAHRGARSIGALATALSAPSGAANLAARKFEGE